MLRYISILVLFLQTQEYILQSQKGLDLLMQIQMVISF